MGKQIFT